MVGSQCCGRSRWSRCRLVAAPYFCMACDWLSPYVCSWLYWKNKERCLLPRRFGRQGSPPPGQGSPPPWGCVHPRGCDHLNARRVVRMLVRGLRPNRNGSPCPDWGRPQLSEGVSRQWQQLREDIHDLVQVCGNSSESAMELLQSCAKPLILYIIRCLLIRGQILRVSWHSGEGNVN